MHTLTVSENIFRYVKTQIILGELTPGQKLNEKELSLLLNVSSAPLREAFRVLQNEHLVTTIPRKGCFVSKISIEDCRQIFHMRALIELGAIDILKSRDIREFAPVGRKEDLGIEFFAELMEDHSKLVKIYKELTSFHIRLVESSGNAWLIRLYNSIFPTLARYQFIGYKPRVMKSRPKVHGEITRLIKDGDFDHAKEVLSQHIGFFLGHLEEVFKEKNVI